MNTASGKQPGRVALILGLALALAGSGCGTYHRKGLAPPVAAQIEATRVRCHFEPAPELRQQIMALDPENVPAAEVEAVLSRCPAPRVIAIHGGISRVIPKMISFSEFLRGMGYPGASLTNPGDGTYTFSCYESSKMIAGMIAWYYEREGLRPVLVGHSQGGMQVVKVLRKFARAGSSKLHVWNPLTWQEEPATDILDPITGKRCPVAGLTIPFSSAVGAGGVTRFLPNQWDMFLCLRAVPDSTEDFTGFYTGMDLLGGDFLGFGPANHFFAMKHASVRNIRLPTSYHHGSIPDTKHLLKSQEIKDWINRYHPARAHVSAPSVDGQFDSDSRNILWAADMWFSIKKHWVLELQRFVQARSLLEAPL